jgi:hypothetical protein
MLVISIAATGARAIWASVGGRRAAAVGAGGTGRQGVEAGVQGLDLLQDHLQLVLGPPDLAGQLDDVRAPGEARVADQQVDRAVGDLRHAHDVLGHADEQRREAVARHEVLHGLGERRLGFVVQPLDVVRRTGSILRHVHLATRGRAHSILASWPPSSRAHWERSSAASGS